MIYIQCALHYTPGRIWEHDKNTVLMYFSMYGLRNSMHVCGNAQTHIYTPVCLYVSYIWHAWSFWATHVSWWRHQMETLSALLAICAGNSPPPVNSPHKGWWRGALIFYLICAWLNGWANNGEAGDLRRHRAHYDVSVMCSIQIPGFESCPRHLKALWTLLICNYFTHHIAAIVSLHYNDVIMSVMVSQITSLSNHHSNVYSGAEERKHQSSTSLPFVPGIHR